jgi:Flp pilus assembly protein TadD
MTAAREGLRASDHCRRAEDLIHLGKLDRAVAEARLALADEPQNARANQLLAWALHQQGKTAEAEQPARTALSFAPRHADAHSTLALILTALGRYQEAEAHHKEAMALVPPLAIYRTRYASLLLRTGRHEAALEQTAEALRLAPRQVEAYIARAGAFLALARFDEAERSARQALALNPNDPTAVSALGYALLGRARPDEAKEKFYESLRLDPVSRRSKRDRAVLLVNRLPFINLWGRYLPLDREQRLFLLALAVTAAWGARLAILDNLSVVTCATLPLLFLISLIPAMVVDLILQALSVILALALFQGLRYALNKGWIH